MRACLKERFHRCGVDVPRLLLPGEAADFSAFSVIACDQFSADAAYWRDVENTVGGAPSALRMMLPEAWLKERDGKGIEDVQKHYLRSGVLRDVGEGFVYIRRGTSAGVRKGLLVALDLEQYDFTPNSKGLIRATEETVVQRLPARVEIRKRAVLEMPHVMVLIRDVQDRLMSALESLRSTLPCLYDFELMKGGGPIAGYAVRGPHLSVVAKALEVLQSEGDGLLYAMGDGNHSFAAAKLCWQELKKTLTPQQRENHPARWSAVELVNLYDPALRFEPIHRALLGVDPKAVQREVGFDAENPPPLQELQPKLDVWLSAHPEAELEYIHGEQACRELCDAPDRLAVILPEFDKDTLFEIVRRDGVLARKSFSMGQARDKRYYLECRAITDMPQTDL